MISWSLLRTRFSLAKLLDIMVKLDRDVEIGFSKSSEKGGSRYFVRNVSGGCIPPQVQLDGLKFHGRSSSMR
ncbi:hypothetical protein B6V72_17545, partial [Thioclava sp. F34-6]